MAAEIGAGGWEMSLKLRKHSGLPAPKAQASCLLEKEPSAKIYFIQWLGRVVFIILITPQPNQVSPTTLAII